MRCLSPGCAGVAIGLPNFRGGFFGCGQSRHFRYRRELLQPYFLLSPSYFLRESATACDRSAVSQS